MISSPNVQKRQIRAHYDIGTPFYWLFWGTHIHHGLWTDPSDSPKRARLRLVEHLAEAASIEAGQRVVDVGCGMGGSSRLLAGRWGCHVTGLTLSPVQKAWGETVSRWQGLGRQVRIRQQDADLCEFPDESFDVVWSIECTEHLFDKPGFFRKAARWLRPEGRVAICAWTAVENLDLDQTRQVETVCEAFLCPSLGSVTDYESWMTAAGLKIQSTNDITEDVYKTWELCIQRAQRYGGHWIARVCGADMVRFVEHLQTIYDAFRTGTMRYLSLVAKKEAMVESIDQSLAG